MTQNLERHHRVFTLPPACQTDRGGPRPLDSPRLIDARSSPVSHQGESWVVGMVGARSYQWVANGKPLRGANPRLGFELVREAKPGASAASPGRPWVPDPAEELLPPGVFPYLLWEKGKSRQPSNPRASLIHSFLQHRKKPIGRCRGGIKEE
jgi:hypothetical protein